MDEETLKFIYGEDIINNYNASIGLVKQLDWNDTGVKLLHIAFYLILECNDEDIFNELHNRAVNKARTISIINKWIEVSKRISRHYDGAFNREYVNDGTDRIRQRLAEFSEYFIREISDDTVYDTVLINDTNKKYLKQMGYHIQNCIDGVEDEIEVVGKFFDEIRLIKHDIKEQAIQARKTSRYGYNYKEGADTKLKDLYAGIKKVLANRLRKINVSKSKIKILTAQAITAIREEIINK